MFLLAHQSIIAKLGYDLQDQKTVKLYHKLRDTYGNAWWWENFWTYKSFFRFLWINYLKNWYLYIRGWNYTISAPNSLDYTKDVILKIQTSFPITSTIDGVDNANSYTMNLEKWGSIWNKHFLRRTSQIKEFEAEFKKSFNLIDGNMTNGVKVHLLMNVPAPFAFVIWSSIHSSSRSAVVLYEERNGKYLETFTLNKP